MTIYLSYGVIETTGRSMTNRGTKRASNWTVPSGRLAPQELTCGADRAFRLTLTIVIIIINVHTCNI